MYVSLYRSFIEHVSYYGTYVEWILSKNRYGKHGKRKVN